MWGLKPFTLHEYTKDLFVTIASIRNSYNFIMDHVASWAVSAADFNGHHVDPTTLAQLWNALGLDHEVVDVLVEYQLIWWGGKRRMKPGAKHMKWLDEVVAALTSV